MITRKMVLKFPPFLVDQPIICQLAKNYNLEFNILRAYVTPKEEGRLVLELKGENELFNEGLNFLIRSGVIVQPLSKDIYRNETRCTHCGACLAVCPSGALTIDRYTMMVNFANEKCIACERCIKACPLRAMELSFD